MTKKAKKPTREELEQSFEQWNNALEGLKAKAEQSFMPLLAKTFGFGQEVLKIYKQAFLNLHSRSEEE